LTVRSLALTTELGLIATRGRVIDRGGYVVATTPDDPSYRDGNFLALPAAVGPGEVDLWTKRFAGEQGDPAIRHVTLRWAGPAADLGARDELAAAGFTLVTYQVMAATTLAAATTDVSLRPLALADVPALGQLAWTIADDHTEDHRRFLARRAAWQSRLVERGLARFWGAFDGDALVGSLGLVPLDRVARYQDVQVAPSHRRRGIAAALLAAAADARGRMIDRIVIVAEPASDAARVYAGIGFATVEHTVTAWRPS
jgi:GNAT superfamily N-acetyltransferase